MRRLRLLGVGRRQRRLFIHPVVIVPMLVLIELAAGLYTAPGIWRDAAWKLLLYLSIGVAMTTPVGIAILAFAPEQAAKQDWLTQNKYILPKEEEVRNNLIAVESEIERLHQEKDEHLQQVEEEFFLKRLLYENGKQSRSRLSEQRSPCR